MYLLSGKLRLHFLILGYRINFFIIYDRILVDVKIILNLMLSLALLLSFTEKIIFSLPRIEPRNLDLYDYVLSAIRTSQAKS